MQAQQNLSELQFVNLHVVDKNYHELHSQLLHKHEDVLELFYIMQGDGQYIVGGKEYIIRPGNLVICNEDILHGEAPFCSREMESYCCVVRGLHLPELPPNTLTRPAQNPTLYFSEDRTAVEHILHALCDLNRHAAVHQAACNALSAALVTLVYDKLEQRQQTNSIAHRNNEEFIQNVTHYLDQHFMESLQLPELGERFHISHYYLSRLFKAETGLSPMKYVMYRKIGESQNLLMNTELPIGTISDRMGFLDNCHFSTTFKKYIGLTPTQYRQHFQTSQK